jgi:uncharacterized protein YecE (DUF72 family)
MIYVGTSGWQYAGWKGRFYPQGLKQGEYFGYYCNKFKTVEINTTFYNVTKADRFAAWRKASPKDFVFSLKLNRTVTQRKKLILDDVSRPIFKTCLVNPQELKEKFGVMLVQLPPGFKANPARLKEFVREAKNLTDKLRYKPRLAFEFRHPSWFCQETYGILSSYGLALAIAHSRHYPMDKVFTADFAYFRFHGPEALFGSSYSLSQLRNWADTILSRPGRVKTVYAYYNNDYNAYAPANATRLEKLIEQAV